MPLAPFQEHAANSPFIAYTRAGELRNYTDIPEFVTKPEELLQIGLKPEKQKQLVHGQNLLLPKNSHTQTPGPT